METIEKSHVLSQPFLFDYLEKIEIVPSASVYTNLGVTKENGTMIQDSDDE